MATWYLYVLHVVLVGAVRLFADSKANQCFADRHAFGVVLMQKPTVIPQRAYAFQPVRAYCLQIGNMPVRNIGEHYMPPSSLESRLDLRLRY